MAADPARHGGRAATPAQGPSDALGALRDHSRRHWPRRLLIGANVVVLALLIAGASAFGYVQWRFGQVDRITVKGLHPTGQDSQSPPASAGPPMTILVVGSDTRTLGRGANAAFGNAESVTGQRSDTIMLVRVVPATSSIALLSVPRDLLVPIAGMGTTRINSAFNSGPNVLVQTIQQDLGIEVNHFAVVNFYSFTQLADALGGVYQYFPTPAKDLYSGLTVPNAGCVLLKGSQALGFVRSREYQYYLDGSWQYQLAPESDLARIQRQQDFVKLAIKKAEHIAPTDPFSLNQVIGGITGSLTVDSSFSNSLMLDLARVLRHTDVSGIPNWTYPSVNSAAVSGALDPVPSLDQQMVTQFLNYGLPPAKTTTTVTTTTTPLGPSAISVEVLNGSGTSGQAGEAAKALKAAGFGVKSTSDAKTFNYPTSVIQYGPNGSAAAKLLQGKVGGGATLQEVSTLTGNNLVLITGRSYNGIVGATTTIAIVASSSPTTSGPPSSAVGATDTTGAAEVAPDSSSYFHGQYIPPGLQPGQVPQTCPS